MILSCKSTPFNLLMYYCFLPNTDSLFILSQGHCFDMLQWLPFQPWHEDGWALHLKPSAFWQLCVANTSPLKPTKNSPPSGNLPCLSSLLLYSCPVQQMQLGLLGCRQTSVLVSWCVKLWFLPTGEWRGLVERAGTLESGLSLYLVALVSSQIHSGCPLSPWNCCFFFLLCGHLPSLLPGSCPLLVPLSFSPRVGRGPSSNLQAQLSCLCPHHFCQYPPLSKGVDYRPSWIPIRKQCHQACSQDLAYSRSWQLL